MQEHFNASRPKKYLFDKIEDAVKYASSATGATIHNSGQIVSRAYLLVLQTSLYNDTGRDWRRCPIAQQSWEIFKTDFAAAHQDLHTIQAATRVHHSSHQ